MLEIERKFLMNGFPEGLEVLSEVEIEQGYVSHDPEVRIRKATDKKTEVEEFYMTIKDAGALTRTEIETDIEADFYYDVIDLLGFVPVKKDYKSYKLGPWKLEVSKVDEGTPHEFFYGEIEFPTEEDAKEFDPPTFFGREITYNEDYKMKNYWKRTRG